MGTRRIRVSKEINDKIINEMRNDVNFRNFICVNIQDLLLTLKRDTHYKTSFLDDYDLLQLVDTELVLINKFGFLIDENSKVVEEYGIDENEAKYYKYIFDTYANSLKWFLPKGTSINFDAHIKKPFKRFLEILGFDKVDEYDDLVCLREKPQGNEIQNAFGCLDFMFFSKTILIRSLANSY